VVAVLVHLCASCGVVTSTQEVIVIKQALAAALAGLLSFGVGSTFADEGKDESGKGKHRNESKERRGGGPGAYFRQHGYTRMPDGHFPPPGECRIWYPDRPAGHQPPPFKCGKGRGRVEPGGWLMTPGPQPDEVEVAVYDPRRPGIVIDVGIFDARTGAMIRVTGSK
jgi:hypothetical protein